MSILTNEQAHPIILATYLTKKYGKDWMSWAPSVLRITLSKEEEVDVAKVNIHKAMACANILTRDEFWTDWHVFHLVCQAINNNIPTVDTLQDHSVGQMLVAVDIANSLRDSVDKIVPKPEFSEDVKRYIASQALSSGVWFLPKPLSFVNHLTTGLSYRCGDCGTVSEVVFDDGLCDVCIERFDTHSLSSWEPNKELVKRGWGKNIKYFEKNPSDKVSKRLDQALSLSGVSLKETQTDICVSRIRVALQYLKHRQAQSVEQGDYNG